MANKMVRRFHVFTFLKFTSGHIKRFPRKKRTWTTHVPEKNKT